MGSGGTWGLGWLENVTFWEGAGLVVATSVVVVVLKRLLAWTCFWGTDPKRQGEVD